MGLRITEESWTRQKLTHQHTVMRLRVSDLSGCNSFWAAFPTSLAPGDHETCPSLGFSPHRCQLKILQGSSRSPTYDRDLSTAQAPSQTWPDSVDGPFVGDGGSSTTNLRLDLNPVDGLDAGLVFSYGAFAPRNLLSGWNLAGRIVLNTCVFVPVNEWPDSVNGPVSGAELDDPCSFVDGTGAELDSPCSSVDGTGAELDGPCSSGASASFGTSAELDDPRAADASSPTSSISPQIPPRFPNIDPGYQSMLSISADA